jgi:hypothetical protein
MKKQPTEEQEFLQTLRSTLTTDTLEALTESLATAVMRRRYRYGTCSLCGTEHWLHKLRYHRSRSRFPDNWFEGCGE